MHLLDLHVNSEQFLFHVTLLKCLSVFFFFLFNSQAHYLDKIVKGTVYLLFDMSLSTCNFFYINI